MSDKSWYEIPDGSRAPRRRAAWLALMALLAFGAAPPAIYYTADLWWRTAKIGWETYFGEGAPPMDPNRHRGLRDWLIDLDLSSLSALIVLLFLVVFFLCAARSVAWVALRHWIGVLVSGVPGVGRWLAGRFCAMHPRWGEGQRFFEVAIDAPLFPRGFSKFCVRLGLISVFVSFLLASVAMMREEERAPGEPDRAEENVRKAVAARGDGPPAPPATPAARAPQARASRRILFSVFAAMTGALAAALVAYCAVPALEGVQSKVMARHLVPAPAPAGPASGPVPLSHDFAVLMGDLRDALRNFESTVPVLRESCRAIAALGDALRGLTEQVGRVTAVVAQNSQSVDRLLAALGGQSAALPAVAADLRRLVDSTVQHRGGLNDLLGRLRELAEAVGGWAGSLSSAVTPWAARLEGMAAGTAETTRLISELLQAFRGLFVKFEAFSAEVVRGEQETARVVRGVETALRGDVTQLNESLEPVGRTVQCVADRQRAQHKKLEELKAEVAELRERVEERVREIDGARPAEAAGQRPPDGWLRRRLRRWLRGWGRPAPHGDSRNGHPRP